MSYLVGLVKSHPKVSAALATAIVAGAAYYGVPPGVTEEFLKGLFGG